MQIKKISFLNIGVLGLAIALDTGEYERLTADFSGATTMKADRDTINERYLYLPKAIEDSQLQTLGLEKYQPSRNISATYPEAPPLPPPNNANEEEIMNERGVTSCDGTSHNSLLIINN